MSNLMAPIAEQDTQIEKQLVQLVAHMTRQVIGRELRTDSSQITQVLREALKLLPMGADNIRIHLNPQDFELAKALRERHEENWRCWKIAPCYLGVAASKPRTVASTRAWKRVPKRPWRSCSTSCTTIPCTRLNPTWR